MLARIGVARIVQANPVQPALLLKNGIVILNRCAKAFKEIGVQAQVVMVGVKSMIVQHVTQQGYGTVTQNQTVPARAAIGVKTCIQVRGGVQTTAL
ncbi:hypothetical protein COT72_04315 [archaeon CG10_big_fil_rev_8_21_14_0_10_43_11]|nr:MAG: hypothetical protein COT72_04315 [archaeon CG10_big_fil_rev_8_21_14_0_10_43_11]